MASHEKTQGQMCLLFISHLLVHRFFCKVINCHESNSQKLCQNVCASQSCCWRPPLEAPLLSKPAPCTTSSHSKSPHSGKNSRALNVIALRNDCKDGFLMVTCEAGRGKLGTPPFARTICAAPGLSSPGVSGRKD